DDHSRFGLPRRSYSAPLNLCFSMRSARILDSSVEGGIESLAAAPSGPDTRPRVAVKAASIIDLSCVTSDCIKGWTGPVADTAVESQLSSTENVSVSQTMMDRSITFCSSRMFPGQP